MKQLLLLITLFSLSGTYAQRGCAFEEKRQQLFARHPEAEAKYNAAKLRQAVQYRTMSTQSILTPAIVVTIPVVVHILYKNNTQNISDEQIASQLAILNQDYSLTNPDFEDVVPEVFQPFGANMEINFVMATTDPDGNPTDGITRKSVSSNFDFYNDYFLTSGEPSWDTEHYLNIWVGKFDVPGLLGFAYGPEAAGDEDDGLCIDYRYFGTEGTAEAPFDGGRTATHEIGHYFGLMHPWGESLNGGCGVDDGDNVEDTPATDFYYEGCPSFPNNANACVVTPNGSMFMNYMDYVNDACMAFFTLGQKTITTSTINNERASLLNVNIINDNSITIYPNPAEKEVLIDSPEINVNYAEFFNQGGKLVKTVKMIESRSSIYTDDLPTGIYYLRLYAGKKFLKSTKLIKR